MNKRILTRSIVASLFVSTLLLTACQKEGPAETAGKSIDHATAKAGEKLENAGEAVGNAVENAGDKVKDATK